MPARARAAAEAARRLGLVVLVRAHRPPADPAALAVDAPATCPTFGAPAAPAVAPAAPAPAPRALLCHGAWPPPRRSRQCSSRSAGANRHPRRPCAPHRSCRRCSDVARGCPRCWASRTASCLHADPPLPAACAVGPVASPGCSRRARALASRSLALPSPRLRLGSAPLASRRSPGFVQSHTTTRRRTE